MRCEAKSAVDVLRLRGIRILAFSQPTMSGQTIAAAGNTSAQNKLTIMVEIDSLRSDFMLNGLMSTNLVWIDTPLIQ